jgi:hypothetical protein
MALSIPLLGRFLSRRSQAGRPAARQPAAEGADEPWMVAYEPIATTEDIRHCFRRLLGRNPNREERRGHRMRAGEGLPGVVASYLNQLTSALGGAARRDGSCVIPPVAARVFAAMRGCVLVVTAAPRPVSRRRT